jgi:hypothetical protein
MAHTERYVPTDDQLVHNDETVESGELRAENESNNMQASCKLHIETFMLNILV